MADENTVGGVSVDVTANISQYEADMARARATAVQTDQALTGSMAHAASAGAQLSTAARSIVEQMVAAGVSAKTAAAAFEANAKGQQQLAYFLELTNKAVKNQATELNATAAAGQAAATRIDHAFKGIDFAALNAKIKQTTQSLSGVSVAGVGASAADVSRATPQFNFASRMTAQRAAEESAAESSAAKIAASEQKIADAAAAAQLATRVKLTKQMGAEAEAEAAALEAAAMREARASEDAAAKTLAARVRFNTQAGKAGNADVAAQATAEARAAKEAAAAEADLASRREKLLAATSPLIAAQQKFAKVQEESNALLKSGVINEAEHAAAVAAGAAALKKTEDGLEHVGKAAINSRVATEGLAAIHEIMQGRTSRLAGTLSILGQAMIGNAKTAELLKLAISPTGLAIEAVAAAAIAGGVALYQFEMQQRNLQKSSVGLGAASGISSGQANQISGQGLLSFKASINDNLKATEAFSAAGVRSSATIRDLNGVVQDFALLTGEKAKDAQKELAEAMKDPVKGAADLNSKLSILDGTQLRQIETLTELGQKTQAQAIITQALKDRTEEAKTAGVEQDNLFHRIAVGASDAATGIGKLIDAELKWGGVAFKTATGNGAALPEQLKRDRDRAEAQAKLQAEARNRADSAAGQPLVDEGAGAIDETAANKLRGNVYTLRAKKAADTDLHGKDSDAVMADVKAIDERNRALSTYDELQKRAAKNGLSVETEKMVELDKAEATALSAKTSAARGEAAATKERLELAGKVISANDYNARVEAAREKGAARGPKDTFAKKDDTLQAQIDGQLALAEAYGKSDAAAMKAVADEKAAVDQAGHKRTASQALKIAQDELNLGAATAAANSAKEAAQLRAETEARTKADAAVASGAMTRKQADEAMKEELARRPIEAALANASGDAKVKLTKVLGDLTKAQKDYNAELEHSLAIDTLDKDKDETAVLKARLETVNAPKVQREVAVAKAQRSAQLGSAASTPEGQASITSAGNKATLNAQVEGAEAFRAMSLEVEKETQALQKQGDTLGMTLQAADKYTMQQKLLLEAERAGVDLTDENRAAIDKLATSYANASEKSRQLAHDQKAAQDASKAVADTVESNLEGVIFDGKKPSDAMRDIAKTLGKDSLKATLTGEGPLAGLFGTDQSKTVGGANGGVLSGIFGSVFGVGKGAGGAKPTGAAGDPLYVKSANDNGGSGGGLLGGLMGGGKSGGGGPLGFISSLFGGGGGMGGAPGADTGGALTELAGLFHAGTSYVGTPHRQIAVDPKVFIGAPRLHQGLAPDEFPAILQHGEKVTAKDGRSRGGGRSIVMNISTNDAASFGRSQRQIERAQQRRAGGRG